LAVWAKKQMMQLQVNELLDLQALDTEIGRLEAERAGLDHGENVERALAVRQARLGQLERRLSGLQVEHRNAELELKTIEGKRHDSTRKLYEGRITAPRELQALEMEVASLDRMRQRLEETLIRRLDEIEAAKKQVETATAARDEAEKALKVVRRRFDKATARIEAELEARAPKRRDLAGKLAPEVLRRYDDIRRRAHNVGAVLIENGACSGCRMKIGGALLRRVIAHEGYVYCESCSRLIFLPAETTG
jgi:predicted  nucleic acid-binding Zn-ribbon protein